MKYAVVICLLLLSWETVAQHTNVDKKTITDLLEVGDTIVFASDTNCVAGFKGPGNSLKCIGTNNAIFKHKNINYTLSESLIAYVLVGKDTVGPGIFVTGYQPGGARAFTAMISCAVKPAKGAILLNADHYTHVSAGNRTDSCDFVWAGQGNNCMESSAKDKDTLAYALEQYFLEHYNLRHAWYFNYTQSQD